MSRQSRLGIVLILPLIAALALSGRTVLASEGPDVDSGTKEEVITRVAEFMKDLYVFPEVGAEMGKYIKAKHDNGDYDNYRDLREFCREVTADMREISHDKHLFVFYSPEEAREVAARKGLLPDEEIAEINRHYYEMSRRNNFGFSKVELLEGNIGYLKLDSFSGEEHACTVATAAMTFLSSADAIIIDLRENGGGGGNVLPLLASYFFDSAGIPLTGAYYRESGDTIPSQTLSDVPGKRLPDVDLYILTSSRTFSAAEDFSYSLKHLGRARIVGENTKGGAHPVDVLIVKGSILTQISIGNSVNPVTGSNWEGAGVIPDIPVPSDKSLRTAHLAALNKLADNTADSELKHELRTIVSRIEQTDLGE